MNGTKLFLNKSFSRIMLLMVLSLSLSLGLNAQTKKKKPTKDDYSIVVKVAKNKLKVNANTDLTVSIEAKNNLKIHAQAPLEIKLKSSAGLKTEKNKLSRKDMSDPKAAVAKMQTKVKALAKGAQTIDLKLSFYLCSDTWCERVVSREKIDMTVE